MDDQGTYRIQSTNFNNHNLFIQTNAEFSPSEAMEFALAIIASIKSGEVKITTNKKFWD